MIWLKSFLTLSLLTWLLMRSNWSQLYHTFMQVSLNSVLLAGLLIGSALTINAVKWQLLLKNYHLLKLFNLNLVALYYSILLPGQIFGEVVKAYRLGKGQPAAEQIAASVAVDKITGLLGVLLVGMGGFYASSQPLPPILGKMFLGMTVFLILCLFSAKLWETPLNRYASLERLLTAWISYRPQVLLNSIFLGIVFQFLSVAIIKTLAQGLQIPLTWEDTCWVFAVVSLALILPLTLAGIGIREGAFVGTLSLLGIPSEKALALSFSIFGLTLLTATVGGLLELHTHLKENKT